jgi:hypothetical protein
MTLLVVEKRERIVYVASDSRYSVMSSQRNNPNLLHTDSGPKIFRLPTKIVGPNHQDQREPDVLYQGSIGLAFAGCADFFATMKARLEWVLEYIQIVPSGKKYSDIITEVVFNTYEKLYEETSMIYEDTCVLFFITDNITHELNAYSISVEIDDNCDIFVRKKKITDVYSFYGSGESKAADLYEIMKQHMPSNIFQFTKKVISECEKTGDSDVGGDMQAGRLDVNGFEVVGIQDYDEENLLHFGFKYCFGGMRMHGEDDLNAGINVTRSFFEIYNDAEKQIAATRNVDDVMQLYMKTI